MKDRLPAILVGVIDTLHKQKDRLTEQHGKEGGDDLKEVVGKLSKMRYEMMTNKTLQRIEDKLQDAEMWNSYFDKQEQEAGYELSWFNCSWLHAECLMYRQIASALKLSNHLSEFDPFAHSKNRSYDTSEDPIRLVIDYMSSQVSSPPTEDDDDIKTLVKQFIEVTIMGLGEKSKQMLCWLHPYIMKEWENNFCLPSGWFLQQTLAKLSLWGNRCDLSISGGQDNAQTTNPLKQIGTLDAKLLVDDFDVLWGHLLSIRSKVAAGNKGRIDIILDNAGFELLTDLCLGEVLISLGFATRVVFHLKSYPWFVSDTMEHDVQYSVNKLQQCELLTQKKVGNNWANRANDGSFIFKKDPYWTSPLDFSEMRENSPNLYTRLAQSDLLIFKGDLNYRKLAADRKWPFETTSFDCALNKFNPAPLLSLRTLKSDVCVGLKPGTAERLAKLNKDWMVIGEYGLIQFTDTVIPLDLPAESGAKAGKQRVTINSATEVRS